MRNCLCRAIFELELTKNGFYLNAKINDRVVSFQRPVAKAMKSIISSDGIRRAIYRDKSLESLIVSSDPEFMKWVVHPIRDPSSRISE